MHPLRFAFAPVLACVVVVSARAAGPPPAPPGAPPKTIDVLTVPSFATAPPADWKLPEPDALAAALGRPGWTFLPDSLTVPAYVGNEGAVTAGVRCKGAVSSEHGFDHCELVVAHLVMAAPADKGGVAELTKARAVFPLHGGTRILPPDEVYRVEPLVLADLNGDQLPEILVRWTVTGTPQRAVGSPWTTSLAILSWLDLRPEWGPTKVLAGGAGSLEHCDATLVATVGAEDPAPGLALTRTCQASICVDAPDLDPACKTHKPAVTHGRWRWNAARSRYVPR